MRKKLGFLLAVFVAAAMLAGCMPAGTNEGTDDKPVRENEGSGGALPAIPDRLDLEDGVPQLLVYNKQLDQYMSMDIEEYVSGVLAGEMRNDWPMEALKAQAILARTFTLKFIEEKQSRYGGADISTDIREAQAYDADKVNDRIKKAVQETRGLVMSADGTLPYAWFHAHAGGLTELAKAGLEYEEDEPTYTQSIESPDSDRAPTAVKQWTARFDAAEVGKAAAASGVKTGAVKTIEIGEKSAAGRALTFVINGKTVSAPALRVNLDSASLKSTLIDKVSIEGDTVTFEGRGYGHGVGMSQWGAYGMAENGEDAEAIISHYFKGIDVVSLWD